MEESLTETKTVQVENLTNALDIAKKQGLKISQEEIIIFLYQNIC